MKLGENEMSRSRYATIRRKVEVLLDAREDALKVKKGAIKAFLRTECVPRVLATMPRIVDDEDDD